MEQVMSDEPFNNYFNPWYFMYQPVSYRLEGRMGTRAELRKMIKTCRSLGVRVYADAVINHMTGGGNDANPYHRTGSTSSCTKWGAKSSSMTGGSSPYYTQDYAYTYGNETNMPPSNEYPAAHYGPLDFHCERALNAWTDGNILNSGWLTGLVDLNTERDNVQERIADYLTDLIGIGFSGFRIDAAKHIKPDDMVGIFTKVKRNLGGNLPADFISWWEILLGGESDLLMCNAASGYNYGSDLESKFYAAGFTLAELNKIKIWNSGYPKETDKGVCTISKVRSAIQNDDHDQQNPGSSSRDMGDTGCVLIKGCSVENHRAFEVKLFSSPNGASDNANDFPIRLVLSSFWWQNQVQGVPDGKSDCSLCKVNCASCQTMKYYPARQANSTGYDLVGYTRVHRDATIINAMRSWMGITSTFSYSDFSSNVVATQ
jgi:alpha-amylase